jgi:polyhydroxyalkanoate synthase
MTLLWSNKAGCLDRRLAPRPLPAHLASAAMLWLTSQAALPVLKDVSLASNVESAVAVEVAHRTERYLTGLDAYRRHPYRRHSASPPIVRHDGATQLLDYGPDGVAPTVLVVPSLINRYYVLDLLPERSFLQHLAGCGLPLLVINRQAPGSQELHLDLLDYIVEHLEPVFAAARQITGAPIGVVGYYGGLLSLALALRCQPQIACLALLATPRDFHAESIQSLRLPRATDSLVRLSGRGGKVPVEAIQTLFYVLDPFSAVRKFIRFASVDPDSGEARSFAAPEDWINDRVPLPIRVAHSCARSWYRDNEPGRGLWRVAGQLVRPQALCRPALVVVPGHDRIVPPGSAEPLAAAFDGSTPLRPLLGYVGMMAATRAPGALWTPIANWLLARLNER